jgi:hypothetical protein
MNEASVHVQWGDNGVDRKSPDHPLYIGRNGDGLCNGVSVYDYEFKKCKDITPITSKGYNGRCSIDIPYQAIPDVVLKLMPGLKFVIEAARNQLPALIGLDPILDVLIEKEMKGELNAKSEDS